MLSTRGISYFVDDVPLDTVQRDLAVIRDDLHCNGVQLIGRDQHSLGQAAELALAQGLDIWIRPSLDNAAPAAVIAHLAQIAALAETLHQQHPGRVTLMVGTEFSLTSRGIVPGPWTYLRLLLILRAGGLLRARIRRRLDALLGRLVATARAHYSGTLTYGAAGWEDVDWSRFDLVGVNLYRYAESNTTYEQRVRALSEGHHQPVFITEFGCGSFDGAERRGAGAFMIINWFKDPPTIRGDHPRNEDAQVEYLTELIDIYDASEVTGCFVFTYAMTDFPRRAEPSRDLDKAGFGIVAVTEDDPGSRIPKRAFTAVAERYRNTER